jgi:hypothetical protein
LFAHAVRQQWLPKSQACPAGQFADVTQDPEQLIAQKRGPSTVQSARHVEPFIELIQSPPHTGRWDGSHRVVVVVVLVVVVVVVVGAGQLGPLPGAGHASQQLVQVPTVPCFAVQWAASFLILHFVPLVVVRQQVTAPGLPQVECDAHFFTAPLQVFGRVPAVTKSLAAWAMQLT